MTCGRCVVKNENAEELLLNNQKMTGFLLLYGRLEIKAHQMNN